MRTPILITYSERPSSSLLSCSWVNFIQGVPHLKLTLYTKTTHWVSFKFSSHLFLLSLLACCCSFGLHLGCVCFFFGCQRGDMFVKQLKQLQFIKVTRFKQYRLTIGWKQNNTLVSYKLSYVHKYRNSSFLRERKKICFFSSSSSSLIFYLMFHLGFNKLSIDCLYLLWLWISTLYFVCLFWVQYQYLLT